jgi:hypothetical protein
VTEPWPVEGENPMPIGELIDEGDSGVLKHAAVSVQQNDRRAFAYIDVMQADSIHLDEVADRRVRSLSLPRRPVYRRRQTSQRRRRAERDAYGTTRPTLPTALARPGSGGLRLRRMDVRADLREFIVVHKRILLAVSCRSFAISDRIWSTRRRSHFGADSRADGTASL